MFLNDKVFIDEALLLKSSSLPSSLPSGSYSQSVFTAAESALSSPPELLMLSFAKLYIEG